MDIATFLLAGTVTVLAVAVILKQNELERRATALRQDITVILDHLDISGCGPSLDKVTALVAEGKRLEAIKVYRELTGASPSDAKEAVERMAGGAGED